MHHVYKVFADLQFMFRGVVKGGMNCLIYRRGISVDLSVKPLCIPADEKIQKN